MTHEEIELLADKMFYSHCAVYGKSPQEEGQHLEMWHHAFRAALDYEREECAKVCESEAAAALENWRNDLPENKAFWNGGEQAASCCAASIRAREA